MAFFPSKYYHNHVNKKHPFMTCIVKVDTQSQWQKTVSSVLRRCHGVHSFRMDDNGVVVISGTADPHLLLETLGKAGRSADVTLFQFGECSSNLFMQTNQATPRDGRNLHAAHFSQPKLPSHRAIDNQSNGYDYDYHDNHYYNTYVNKQDYYHDYHDNHYYNTYGNKQDYYHDYHQHYGYIHNDPQRSYEFRHGGNQIQSRSATRTRSGEDMSCCRVM